MRAAALGLVVFLLFAYMGMAEVLTHDSALDGVVPAEAYQGVGSWVAGEYLVATGHSIDLPALGEAKGKVTQQAWAEDDCRHRLIVQAARLQEAGFDEDCYDVEATLPGFRTAATFKIEHRESLFLIGVVKKQGVQVQIKFSVKKARVKAIDLFDAGHYNEAATRFAVLTQQGVQDPETAVYAQAASWHVNLDAGVKGDGRREALTGLGRFYLDRRNREQALNYLHALYLETAQPSRDQLETLADLAQKTGRERNAQQFLDEIERRWPKPPPIRDADISKPYDAVLLSQRGLLTLGGAALVRYDGHLYFVAVGFTDARGDSSEEKLRQLRVGMVQAQRQAVVFTESTTVVATDKSTVETTVTNAGGRKTASVVKTIDETTMTEVKGVVKSLQNIGTWKSDDGKLFFFAIGRQID